jgi:hemerythrin
MAIQWKDEYRIGDEEIDAQHEEIFKRANAFLEIMDIAALTEYAVGFFQYTRDHFSHEESLMRELDYPEITGHLQQHKDLLARLNSLARKIGSEELTHQEFEIFLIDWLVDHIRIYDTKLAAYIDRKSQAYSPRSSRLHESRQQV